MNTTTRLPLTQKEGEAIMWCLGEIADYPDRTPTSPADPLYVLMREGFSREQIVRSANAMFPVAYGDWIERPFGKLNAAILRVCVENTSWLQGTRENVPELLDVAKAALRSLARKLDTLGIEVNFIASD